MPALLIDVKVTPKARCNLIVGRDGHMLKIKVTAAPEKGEANWAVIALLSETFCIPKKNITLVRGATSRLKTFSLEGISSEEFEKALSQT